MTAAAPTAAPAPRAPARERWLDPGATSEAEQLLLCDAQASGGLLVAVSAEGQGALLLALEKRGVTGTRIGYLDAGLAPGRINLV